MTIRAPIFLMIIVILVMVIPQMVSAEGEVIDPALKPLYSITCIDPVAREDSTPLALGDIANRKFWLSIDKLNWQLAGENKAVCGYTYDMSQKADGQYYLTATTVDSDGRESIFAINNPENAVSGGYVAVVVKRVPPPKSPTGIIASKPTASVDRIQ